MSDVIAGIDWAVQNGAEVISMSLGTSTSSNALQEACDETYEKDVFLVAAAGNSEGWLVVDCVLPAAYEPVVAVATTDKNNERGPLLNIINIDNIYIDVIDIIDLETKQTTENHACVYKETFPSGVSPRRITVDFEK